MVEVFDLPQAEHKTYSLPHEKLRVSGDNPLNVSPQKSAIFMGVRRGVEQR